MKELTIELKRRAIMWDYPVGEIVETRPARVPEASKILAGQFVTLRRPNSRLDAAHLFEASHGPHADPGQWTYMSFGPFDDAAAMEAWLETISDSSDPLFLVVCDVESGKPLGAVSFLNIQPGHRTVELGNIWYVPAAQHTVANTETIFLLAQECFDVLGFRRVEWKCDSLNSRSRQAAERLGFTFEGVFRQHYIVKGRNRDTAWYSMLDSEWQQLRPAYREFLYDANSEARLSNMIAERIGSNR